MSAETKWTPGPWHTCRAGYSTVYVEARIGGGTVQEVAACGPTVAGSEQQEANAHLIAAAPELYEALVKLVSWMPGPLAWHFDAPIKAVERAREVLAKARGMS